MQCAILSSVTCPLYSICPNYLINCAIFEKKNLLNTKCVFWFSLQLLSETFLIIRRNERDMIVNVYRSACKVPVILVRLLWNFNFLDRFSKKSSNIKFHENPSSGSQVALWDRQTDRHDERNSLGSVSSPLCVWKLENGMQSNTTMSIKAYLMTILDNYMFRHLLAIFRLS